MADIADKSKCPAMASGVRQDLIKKSGSPLRRFAESFIDQKFKILNLGEEFDHAGKPC